MRINFTLTILFCCLAATVKGQVMSKLTAQANLAYNSTSGYTPRDSSAYAYSLLRGSDMKTGLYLFDTSIRYQDQGSGLELRERYLRTYENATAMRIQSETEQVYTNGAWENNQRRTYHYPAAFGTNNSAKKDTILIESWNKFSNAWYNLTRISFTYNANKDVTEELVQKFNNLNQTWANERLISRTYLSNRMNSRVEKEWDATAATWTNVQQIVYTYTGSNLTKETTEGWNRNTSAWEKMIMIEYAYNASGENISKTFSRWLPPTSSWEYMHKDQYEYTGANLTADTFSSWDPSTSKWTQNWLYTYKYDNSNNLLSAMTRTPGPDSFLYYRMQEWTYNSYNQPTRFLASEWDFVAKAWVPMNGPLSLTDYYYGLFDVGVKYLSKTTDVTIFPVPAQSFFVVGLELQHPVELRAALYDMQGRMLKYWSETAAQNYRKTVPVSELPNGIYILHINAGDKDLTQTLSIQR